MRVLMRGTCPDQECKVHGEQCDVYLQVSTFSCHGAARLYLGTVLGPPMGVKFMPPNAINSITLREGCLSDSLFVEWGRVGIQYQGRFVPLPSVLKVKNPWTRRKLRHFKRGLNAPDVITNLCLIYNNHLLIRPVGSVTLTKEEPNSSYYQLEMTSPVESAAAGPVDVHLLKRYDAVPVGSQAQCCEMTLNHCPIHGHPSARPSAPPSNT